MKRQFLNNISWQVYVALFILFLLISNILYIQIIPSYFLSDDFDLITRVSEEGLYMGWGGFLRPLIVLSYFIDYTLWNFHPIGYHLTNISLHALNALLLSIFTLHLFRLLIDIHPNIKVHISFSLLSALYFLVLPCHTESVSWISGRTDIIATCFILFSLITWCSYLITLTTSSLGLSLISFALALYAKETALVVPFILFVLACMRFYHSNAPQSRVSLHTIFKGWLVFVAVELIYFLNRYYTLGTFLGGYGSDIHMTFMSSHVLGNLARYSIRIFVAPLSPIYSKVLNEDNLTTLGLLEAGSCFTIIIITAIFHTFKISQRLLSNRQREVLVMLLCWGGMSCFLIPIIRMHLFWYTTPFMQFTIIGLTLLITFLIILRWFHYLSNDKKEEEAVWLLPLLLCFLFSLLPVITMDVSLFDTQSERFLYFPSIFVALFTICMITFLIKCIPIKIIVVFLLITFSGFQLWQVNLNWSRAGELSQNILSSLVKHISHSHILILNIPDNLNGAYVFRNGLSSALRVLMNNPSISSEILVHHSIHSIQETAEINQQHTNPLHFSLLLPENVTFDFNKQSRYIEIFNTQPALFEFTLKDKVEHEYDIFMYTSGTMKELFLTTASTEIEKDAKN